MIDTLRYDLLLGLSSSDIRQQAANGRILPSGGVLLGRAATNGAILSTLHGSKCGYLGN